MSDPKMTTSRELFTCPGCEQEVHATFAYSIALGDAEPESREIAAKVSVVGVSVSHNCIPAATR